MITVLGACCGTSAACHVLLLSCRQQGLVVQGFKVGPDFLDPMHHAAATGRPSINLDGWMLTREQVLATFHRCASILEDLVKHIMCLVTCNVVF